MAVSKSAPQLTVVSGEQQVFSEKNGILMPSQVATGAFRVWAVVSRLMMIWVL